MMDNIATVFLKNSVIIKRVDGGWLLIDKRNASDDKMFKVYQDGKDPVGFLSSLCALLNTTFDKHINMSTKYTLDIGVEPINSEIDLARAKKKALNLVNEVAIDDITPEQIKDWATIDKMMEDNPGLPYSFVKQVVKSTKEKERGKLEEYKFEDEKKGEHFEETMKVAEKVMEEHKETLKKLAEND